MDTKLNITYNPDANAIYARISEFQEAGTGETEVDDFGVIIDTEADGSPRGYARALNDFISSGALASEVPVQRDYDT